MCILFPKCSDSFDCSVTELTVVQTCLVTKKINVACGLSISLITGKITDRMRPPWFKTPLENNSGVSKSFVSCFRNNANKDKGTLTRNNVGESVLDDVSGHKCVRCYFLRSVGVCYKLQALQNIKFSQFVLSSFNPFHLKPFLLGPS